MTAPENSCRFRCAARTAWFLLSLLSGWASGAGAQAPSPEAAEERWYRIEVDGAVAGWSVERQEVAADRISSETQTVLRLARGETAVAVEISGRFEETPEGRPLSCALRQKLGNSPPLEQRYRFLEGAVELTTEQDGTLRTTRLPWPSGDWFTPAAAGRELRRLHGENTPRYTLRLLDPTQGLEPLTITRERLEARVEVLTPEGATRVASRWREEQSFAPGVASTVDLDEAGEVVRSVVQLFGAEMVFAVTDRTTAQAGEASLELVVRSFVRPDRPIPTPREVHRAVYELRVPTGEFPLPPSTGGQTAELLPDGNGARVTVSNALPAPLSPAPTSAELAPYLAASALINSEDPTILALARRAAGDAGGTLESRIEAMRRFVYRYLETKDLGTAFGSAVEAATTRRGDCTEHSVLLAALLRARKVPARVAAGLVYVDSFLGEKEVFGHHMWVQAFYGGRWVDLDPSFPDRFDATHILLATSSLADGGSPGGGIERLVAVIGRLSLRVVGMELPGPPPTLTEPGESGGPGGTRDDAASGFDEPATTQHLGTVVGVSELLRGRL